MSETVEKSEVKKPRKSTTKKPTSPKAKAEPKEEAVTVAMQDQSMPMTQMEMMMQQMAQMQQMMAQQQAIINGMMQQQVAPTQTIEEEPKESRVRKTSGKSKGVTKAQLRRKYKDTDVFLVSTVPGSCSYIGRNGYSYVWNYMGDVQAVPVEDVLNMPEIWLTSPWVGIDEEDNDEQLIDDLVTCLHLESIYEHLYILNELEGNINEVDVEKVKEIVAKSKDTTLAKDIASIVQEKIKKGELTNFHTITDFEKILKCNFKKDND